jgi:hypothetical protein
MTGRPVTMEAVIQVGVAWRNRSALGNNPETVIFLLGYNGNCQLYFKAIGLMNVCSRRNARQS